MRMFGEHSIALRKQLLHGRELRAVEAPVRMLDQLLVALVAGIDRMKKCLRICRVNKYRNAKPSTFFPRRVEARVVDRDKFAGRITNAEAEFLQNFQPARAAGDRVVDLANHELAEIRMVDLRPVKLREHDETTGIRLDHAVDDALQFVSPHAREDNDGLEVEPPHARDHFLWIDPVSDTDSVVSVGVYVDHGKFRALEFMHRGMKRGFGVKVLQ